MCRLLSACSLVHFSCTPHRSLLTQNQPTSQKPDFSLIQLALPYFSLPYSRRDVTLLLSANMFPTLLTLATCSRVATEQPVCACSESASSTSQEQGQTRVCYSPQTTCTTAFTGRVFTHMEVYECRTCGLTNGNLCCRACAQLCHKGEYITPSYHYFSSVCICAVVFQLN